MDDTLFDLPPAVPHDERTEGPGRPRVQRPDRDQGGLRPTHLDGLLPPDHRARLVWDFVTALDLGPLYASIRAIGGHAGRPPVDPASLLALWPRATLEGAGSARAPDRPCGGHDARRWCAGAWAPTTTPWPTSAPTTPTPPMASSPRAWRPSPPTAW